MGGVDRSGWTDMRTGDAPRWLRRPGVPYWFDFDMRDSSVFVAYRGVVSLPSPTNQQFWQSVFAATDSLPVSRLVIDLRENFGGNSFYNRQVIRGIVARPRLDQRGRLFAIVGPQTFSAAMNLALDLERWTNVTFVGAPTGNATVFFGDHEQIRLPASGITVNISTLPWYPDDPRDKRSALAPALYTPISSEDYRTGNDPALRAIASTPITTLRRDLESALARSDAAAAERLVRAVAADSMFRFRSAEGEVNALGYELLNAGRHADAIAVFAINTRVFPRSANAWDSLGEAQVVAGRRDDGIASYRRALAIDPRFASALQALERLGVSRP
jgi:hypothetical protein